MPPWATTEALSPDRARARGRLGYLGGQHRLGLFTGGWSAPSFLGALLTPPPTTGRRAAPSPTRSIYVLTFAWAAIGDPPLAASSRASAAPTASPDGEEAAPASGDSNANNRRRRRMRLQREPRAPNNERAGVALAGPLGSTPRPASLRPTRAPRRSSPSSASPKLPRAPRLNSWS